MRTVVLDEFDYVVDKIYVSYTINEGGKENIDVSYIESVLQERLHNAWE